MCVLITQGVCICYCDSVIVLDMFMLENRSKYLKCTNHIVFYNMTMCSQSLPYLLCILIGLSIFYLCHPPCCTWSVECVSSLCSTDPWIYPLTDSSYDSPENELDNSSGGSPGFCNRRLLPSKPLQGSYDSILTFSDHDDHLDRRHAQTILSPLGRSRGQEPDISSPDIPTITTSSTLDCLSMDGRHRLRRRSEPAIVYMSKLQSCISRTADEDQDGEEELSKKALTHTGLRGAGDSGLNLLSPRSDLEASCSSLSSDPISPAPTRSSLDSLDSLSSDHTLASKWGLNPPKTSTSSSPSVSSSLFSVGSALTCSGLTDQGTCPKETAPKEPLNWGTLKGCRGLHPNSWLRKDRRLSLTQQDNLEKEEDDKTGVSTLS